MSASKLPLHGRNHLPGGSDPIRFLFGAWAELGLDGDTSADGTSYPAWLEGGFYTSEERVYSYDDGSSTFGNHPGIKIEKSGLYLPFASMIVGSLPGDHSADTVALEQVFVDGGDVDDFLGANFGDYLQPGLYSPGTGTQWIPHLLAPLNLRPAHVPGTLTFTITQTTGSDIISYPRLFVVRLSEALDTDTPVPTA